MKNSQILKKFAALIVICMIVLVCVSCDNTNRISEVKKCAYCGGNINTLLIKKEFLSDTYEQQWIDRNGKYYHLWCVKIMDIENKLKNDSLKTANTD
ncbi:MAG: hypothetical protein WC373_09655 [Smithella sp.]